MPECRRSRAPSLMHCTTTDGLPTGSSGSNSDTGTGSRRPNTTGSALDEPYTEAAVHNRSSTPPPTGGFHSLTELLQHWRVERQGNATIRRPSLNSNTTPSSSGSVPVSLPLPPIEAPEPRSATDASVPPGCVMTLFGIRVITPRRSTGCRWVANRQRLQAAFGTYNERCAGVPIGCESSTALAVAGSGSNGLSNGISPAPIRVVATSAGVANRVDVNNRTRDARSSSCSVSKPLGAAQEGADRGSGGSSSRPSTDQPARAADPVFSPRSSRS